MNNSGQALKQSSKVALAAMAVLLIGAFVLYRERALFADGAFLTFNIINYKTLAIQWNRYGSIVSQIFPWVGAKVGFPLRTILLGYAVSFNVFYFLVAAIL